MVRFQLEAEAAILAVYGHANLVQVNKDLWVTECTSCVCVYPYRHHPTTSPARPNTTETNHMCIDVTSTKDDQYEHFERQHQERNFCCFNS